MKTTFMKIIIDKAKTQKKLTKNFKANISEEKGIKKHLHAISLVGGMVYDNYHYNPNSKNTHDKIIEVINNFQETHSAITVTTIDKSFKNCRGVTVNKDGQIFKGKTIIKVAGFDENKNFYFKPKYLFSFETTPLKCISQSHIIRKKYVYIQSKIYKKFFHHRPYRPWKIHPCR